MLKRIKTGQILRLEDHQGTRIIENKEMKIRIRMQRKKDEKNTEDLKRVITEVANTVSFTSLKMDYSFQIVWLCLNHE